MAKKIVPAKEVAKKAVPPPKVEKRSHRKKVEAKPPPVEVVWIMEGVPEVKEPKRNRLGQIIDWMTG